MKTKNSQTFLHRKRHTMHLPYSEYWPKRSVAVWGWVGRHRSGWTDLTVSSKPPMWRYKGPLNLGGKKKKNCTICCWISTIWGPHLGNPTCGKGLKTTPDGEAIPLEIQTITEKVQTIFHTWVAEMTKEVFRSAPQTDKLESVATTLQNPFRNYSAGL